MSDLVGNPKDRFSRIAAHVSPCLGLTGCLQSKQLAINIDKKNEGNSEYPIASYYSTVVNP